MDRQVSYDQKRCRLLRRGRLFHYVPFVRAVFIAGSMAIGNARENSDFDVIVVVSPGRLYTARFFSLALFKIFGWRSKLARPKDGFCLNYFRTDGDFSDDLADFDNQYARVMYDNLAPLEIGGFCPWENFLEGSFGRWLEQQLKVWQIKKIKNHLRRFPPAANARIIYDDRKVQLCFFIKDNLS